jgi:hypothetical protein
VVKLGAKALDINATTPGRFCPAYLIDRLHAVAEASLSSVGGHRPESGSLVVWTGSVLHFALHEIE